MLKVNFMHPFQRTTITCDNVKQNEIDGTIWDVSHFQKASKWGWGFARTAIAQDCPDNNNQYTIAGQLLSFSG